MQSPRNSMRTILIPTSMHNPPVKQNQYMQE
jgi:hypothetical protein